MTNETKTTPPPHKLVELGPMLLAGIREFRSFSDRGEIPGQWQRFVPYLWQIPGQIGGATFGACFNSGNEEEGFDYMPCAQVMSLDDLPDGLSGARVPKHTYAVFPHAGHVSSLPDTCSAIFSGWTPPEGLVFSTGALTMLEKYDARFDPMTGRGGLEVLIPLEEIGRQ